MEWMATQLSIGSVLAFCSLIKLTIISLKLRHCATKLDWVPIDSTREPFRCVSMQSRQIIGKAIRLLCHRSARSSNTRLSLDPTLVNTVPEVEAKIASIAGIRFSSVKYFNKTFEYYGCLSIFLTLWFSLLCLSFWQKSNKLFHSFI